MKGKRDGNFTKFIGYCSDKEGGEKETMQAMGWKKLFKSLLIKYPKFSGWCTYFNKKGHLQVKALQNGKLMRPF